MRYRIPLAQVPMTPLRRLAAILTAASSAHAHNPVPCLLRPAMADSASVTPSPLPYHPLYSYVLDSIVSLIYQPLIPYAIPYVPVPFKVLIGPCMPFVTLAVYILEVIDVLTVLVALGYIAHMSRIGVRVFRFALVCHILDSLRFLARSLKMFASFILAHSRIMLVSYVFWFVQ